MMQREGDEMLARLFADAEIDDEDAQKRPLRQIEGPTRLPLDETKRLGGARIRFEIAQIDEGTVDLQRWRDDLSRFAIDHGKARPQRLVPRHDRVHRPGKGRNVQRADKAKRARVIIGGAIGLNNIEQP